MHTYKFHALGDYVSTIKAFGTTDSYMTQVGELSHRLIKKFYGLTSKRDIGKQLARQERRLTHVRRQQQASDSLSEFDNLEISDMDSIPELHHVLTHSPNNTIDLRMLLCNLRAQGDPAIKGDFISKLKDHILSRLYQYDYDGDERGFTAAQCGQLFFIDNLNRCFLLDKISRNAKKMLTRQPILSPWVVNL
ncbi:hypothetical protein HD554DRAFT_2177981 [Boletus coccyginus]|nr:hypothetical protein HD554DRAFT_2177981 [Boletus coccyginus]